MPNSYTPAFMEKTPRWFYAKIDGIKASLAVQQGRHWHKNFPLYSKNISLILCQTIYDHYIICLHTIIDYYSLKVMHSFLPRACAGPWA